MTAAVMVMVMGMMRSPSVPTAQRSTTARNITSGEAGALARQQHEARRRREEREWKWMPAVQAAEKMHPTATGDWRLATTTERERAWMDGWMDGWMDRLADPRSSAWLARCPFSLEVQKAKMSCLFTYR